MSRLWDGIDSVSDVFGSAGCLECEKYLYSCRPSGFLNRKMSPNEGLHRLLGVHDGLQLHAAISVLT